MSAASEAGRIGVWGRSGSGKSSYVKKRIKRGRRIVIFDPLDEYGREGFRSIGPSVDQVRGAMRRNWRGFRIAYVPPVGKEVQALSILSNLLLAAQGNFKNGTSSAGITLVVEEMNTCFPVAGGAEKCRGFAEICSRGRHYGIEVLGVSQRIAEVATRFRGNCTETVVFPQKGPRDTKAAAAELGVNPARVTALTNLHYLHEKGGVVTSGAVTFGRKRAANDNHPRAANDNEPRNIGAKRKKRA